MRRMSTIVAAALCCAVVSIVVPCDLCSSRQCIKNLPDPHYKNKRGVLCYCYYFFDYYYYYYHYCYYYCY